MSEPTSHPNYVYSPLPAKRSIRLMNVISAVDHIGVTLKAFSLDSLPPFEALSYSWGKATSYEDDLPVQPSSHKIKCDSGFISVTDNLFDALAEFSRTEPPEAYFWIDALCIDQGSPEERSSQVLLMGEIYSNATRTVAWLGSDKRDLEGFLWAHEVFLVSDFKGKNEELGDFIDPTVHAYFGLAESRWVDHWKSWLRFLETRCWFKRAWVLQEVALSRELNLRCGHCSVTWDALWDLNSCLDISGWLGIISYHLQIRFVPDILKIFQSLQTLIEKGGSDKVADLREEAFGRAGLKTQEEFWLWCLNSLLTDTRLFETTLPVDKVYCVLGMATKFLPLGIETPITPNYSATVKSVYKAATLLLLHKIPIFWILSVIEDPSSRKTPSLPSWCPDYDSPVGKFPFGELFNNSLNYKAYNACKVVTNSQPNLQILGDTLQLRGRRVDEIIAVSRPLEDITKPQIYPTIDWIQISCYLPQQYPHTSQDRVEVFWRTLIGNVNSTVENGTAKSQYPAPDHIGRIFFDWVLEISARALHFFNELPHSENNTPKLLADMSTVYSQLRTASHLIPSVEEIQHYSEYRTMETTELPHLYQEHEKVPVNFQSYQYALNRRIAGRSIFRTNHHYLGIGPESTCKDDELWLLEGVEVPFILRPIPNSNNYSLIGEAYAHGIMDGELLGISGYRDGFKTVNIK